ncbi:MAG: PAS domain S-box protein [Desulfobacterales bacterium]|nr:PAS domain S-box protein [Desulfobacterales bacterium]
MNLPLNYDTPNGFSLSECPHGSGTPVFSSPEWTDIQLAEDYQVTFHKIGSHILSAYPKGKITYEGTCALFDAYDKFLQASGLSRSSFVEISDYSGIVNLPSKRARFEVAERLLEKTKQNNLIGHFVYNVPKHIKWIYNIGIRLKQPGIPMMAVDTYKEALDQALRLKTNKAGTQGMIPQAENDLDLKRTSPEHIQDILDYLGSINWDEAGMREENIPESHPLKPVFNAIAILKADHDATRDEREKIQEKYKHLFNRISDPILVFDKNTQKILDWNQAFLSTYGFSQEELVTMTPKHLHPLEELDRVNRNIGKHAPGKIGRYTHVTKSGESMDVEIRTDETDYQGRSAWISTIRDITEQNRLEKELRRHRDALEGVVKKRTRALEQEIADRKQTETKFKTLFDLNADAVLLLDKNGFIDCNQAALDLFGCTSKEELSDLGLGGISPKFQENGRISEPLARENLGLAFELGTNQFEWIHLNNKTRRTFPADVVLHRMTLDGKDVLQAIVRDITQRRESEEALRQSEEKYRGMIENMQDVFFRTDLSWNLTMISPSGLSLLGYGSDTQILGQNIGKLFFNKSQEFDRFKENLNTYGNVRYFELDLITRENEIIPVISSCTLYTDALDTPHGIEGTITNIKAQKEAEDTLRLAKRQAESAAKTKSDFLANMSHEIRTPLNAILGMAELVRETELNDYQKNLMTTINTEASSLLGIINSILDFSKVEAGRMELETTPFNLRVLFEDLATSFAVTAHRKELEFISFLSPDTPEQLVGDPGRIRQVLVNLVGNAIKFTQDGEIFIWVDLLEDTKERVSLRFNVKDTGIGIPKDKQDYIFESFAQADGSTTRKYGGTGLGTAISKELVTLMNGRIGVESEHGKGALFWFTIPLAKHIEQKTAPRFQDVWGLVLYSCDQREKPGKRCLFVHRGCRFVA